MPVRHRPPAGLASVAQRVEGFLLRVLILVLLLLVVGQSLLSYDGMRALFSYVDVLEGAAYDPESAYGDAVGATFLSEWDARVLTVSVLLISMPSAPDAHLLVNGFAVADFEQPHLTIEVHDGDRLEIDGRAAAEDLRFRVVDVSPELAEPVEGHEIVVQGDRKPLGVVRLRQGP